MFRYDDALDKAIERKELSEFLCGEGEYYYEDKMTDRQVSYAKALRCMYVKYKTYPEIADEFVNNLRTLASGTPEQVSHAIAFVAYHMAFAGQKENTFSFDVEPIIGRVKDSVAKNVEEYDEVILRTIESCMEVIDQCGDVG